MKRLVILAAMVMMLRSGWAGPDPKDVTIQSQKVRDSVYLVTGQGGNIGVLTGKDGIVLIDDQFSSLSKKIREEVYRISKKPLRFVINTHWHQDHTDGNPPLGKAGAVIVAHENVRKRLSIDQVMTLRNKTVPKMDDAGLPIVTFTQDITFHLNGQTVEVFHVPSAHTDGDSIIHFKEANVIHAGDVFREGKYPFIDLDSGGSVDGILKGVEAILLRADRKTRIIPGHGAVSTKKQVADYGQMIAEMKQKVQTSINSGKLLKEVLAQNLSRKFDEQYGGDFVSGDQFVEALFRDLSEK